MFEKHDPAMFSTCSRNANSVSPDNLRPNKRVQTSVSKIHDNMSRGNIIVNCSAAANPPAHNEFLTMIITQRVHGCGISVYRKNLKQTMWVRDRNSASPLSFLSITTRTNGNVTTHNHHCYPSFALAMQRLVQKIVAENVRFQTVAPHTGRPEHKTHSQNISHQFENP